ncbi:hypothetical protein I3843_01G198700 [Carya illinoinensis]|uniref:F-box domain-containing protein n=1 Tax=Carya illinoinensis TaxID=32201 RepID=A0A922G2S8_CARIL|nr:uncharacterized protein LOC122279156 isoform X2 [Carya illinoinensis]KAG2728384.1 hypothetical protein I3760_01G203000 [Carya illinoinensis]KAG6733021.1 hypothetical protein I3842_01G206100 [Carya illinoinensis]KAG7997168.1 hypothetical protein I3843_01G198700 [Carya illinoinensis]
MAQAELQEKQTKAPESRQKYDFVGEEMERHRKRKRRKRDGVTVEFVEKKKKEEEGVLRRDPLEVFGTDIMLMILSNLDARSVALSLLVSRGWHGVASSDRIWGPKLEELWLGKAHIPRLTQIRGLSKLVAYSLAVMDGKRNRIMKDDLCDHVWEFHFNKPWPAHKSHVCHLRLQNIGEILILTGRVQAHPCAATFIQMGAKVQILMTKYGAVMNAVT